MSNLTFAPANGRLTEAGNLYTGDLVALPGDMLATVLGFAFPANARPDAVTLVTDLAVVPCLTTDLFRVFA